MTDTVAAADLANAPPARRRCRLTWIVVGVVVAALIAVPTWWVVATDTSHLERGAFAFANEWQIHAGDTPVYCYGIAPGDSIRLGFSLRNASSHTITITGISLAMDGDIRQTITVSRMDPLGANGPELPFAPVTLPPQYEADVFVQLLVPNDMRMSGGMYKSTDIAVTDYRVLGRQLHRLVPLGLWFEFNHPAAGKLPCQPTPAMGG